MKSSQESLKYPDWYLMSQELSEVRDRLLEMVRNLEGENEELRRMVAEKDNMLAQIRYHCDDWRRGITNA